MRKSIYDRNLEFPYDVYLDGEIIEWCVMADEENGMVEVYALNADGEPFIKPGTDYLQTKFKYGKVKIKRLKK